jgi:hypothetical protein
MLKQLSREALDRFVSENSAGLTEQETLAVLENPYCSAAICQTIARSPRLTGFYSVRAALVGHRQTPHAHSVKLIHYLFWPDLVHLSLDMTVAAPVRRAIDTQLLIRLVKLTAGEKITAARRCSEALIKELLFDDDDRVLTALLVNQRLREEHLLLLMNSTKVTAGQLAIIASDRKWSFRYPIRKGLVLNVLTPRSIAASQLRFLTRRDRRDIYRNPQTSVYLRRCIERMGDGPPLSPPGAESPANEG